MVEVDPKLFVTCRLCLDVEGHFQIVPSVQQHIKYCFDIDVEPFDRLPQLICKTCESILKEYYTVKKKFKEKQEELKAKLQNNIKQIKNSPLRELEESDSSSSEPKAVITRKRKHKTKKTRNKRVINRLLSSSDNSSDEKEIPKSSLQLKEKKSISKNEPASWEKNLTKYYACRICSQRFVNLGDIRKHTHEHTQLLQKYENIFNTSCLVVMEKFDSRPNFTNCSESVVYNSDRILQNKHNPYYYIVYNANVNSVATDNNIEANINYNFEYSDGEVLGHKRERLLSRSSGETIDLQNFRPHDDALQASITKNHQSPTVIDCIDIESSENDSDHSNNENKLLSKIKNIDDPKGIHTIVKICYNRYVKKLDCMGPGKLQNDKLKESHLQHKLLSIGRKIINNQQFNCTGILRFLEYKDLSVIWKDTGSDGKFVQIATRKRGSDNSDENCLGWKKLNEIPLEADTSNKNKNILSKVKKIRQVLKKSNAKSITNELENLQSENLPRITSVFNLDLQISKTTDSDGTLKKLLNQTPVSNPKQLPKKTNDTSTLKITKVFSGNKISGGGIDKIVQISNHTVIDENIEFDRSMPIITSAVSLSSLSENNTEKNCIPTSNVESLVSNNEPPTHYPRIKVKPVSELMAVKPQTCINTMKDYNFPICNDSHNVLACNNNSLGNDTVWSSQNFVTSEQLQLMTNTSEPSNNDASDYIILDTVEFPNTRTNSPFKYLQNLLLLHNITLLDSNIPLPPDSKCLIKLKVMYNQEISQSVTLNISLYCCNNIFAMKVQDVQLREVNICKFPAHWQWQLLVIFNDGISNKILETAHGYGEMTYKYTNTFLTLLNSIKNVIDVSFVGNV